MGNRVKIVLTALAVLTAGNTNTVEPEEAHAESSAYIEMKLEPEAAEDEEPPTREIPDPEPEPEKEPAGFEKPVCDTGADFASYMDFRALTKRTSAQYQLQQQAETNEDGHRTHNGQRLIAVHSQYGTTGEQLRITFADGSKETFTIGDTKANTDCSHEVGNGRRSIIEFIIDSSQVSTADLNAGEIQKYSQPLIKIERLEP